MMAIYTYIVAINQITSSCKYGFIAWFTFKKYPNHTTEPLNKYNILYIIINHNIITDTHCIFTMETQKKKHMYVYRSNQPRHKHDKYPDSKKVTQNYIHTAIALMHIKQVQFHEIRANLNAPKYRTEMPIPAYVNKPIQYTKKTYSSNNMITTPFPHIEPAKLNNEIYTRVQSVLSVIENILIKKNNHISVETDINHIIEILNKYTGHVMVTVKNKAILVRDSIYPNKSTSQYFSELLEFIQIHIRIHANIYKTKLEVTKLIENITVDNPLQQENIDIVNILLQEIIRLSDRVQDETISNLTDGVISISKQIDTHITEQYRIQYLEECMKIIDNLLEQYT
jgi:hypothetical protein